MDKGVVAEIEDEGRTGRTACGVPLPFIVLVVVFGTLGYVIFDTVSNEDSSTGGIQGCSGNPAVDCISLEVENFFQSRRRLAGAPVTTGTTTSFSCEAGYPSCDLGTNCNSDVFYLAKAFLIGDEKGPSERNHAAFEACGIRYVLFKL